MRISAYPRVPDELDLPKGVLITQCLQNDFVKPLPPYTPLPNLLHVGHDEARRLMGDDPAQRPVARFLAWALAQPDDRLRVVHIRDWHDPTDPSQREHLAHFGPHGLRGTDGAAFAFPSLPAAGKQVVTVDGDALNDFLHSNLGAELDGIIASCAPGIRLGIVGVWTEAKVTFLAYELRARHPDARIGVCAALTAGSSRAQHFAALDQLRRLLGVEVFASVAGFARFLAGDDTELPLPPRGPTGVTLELEGLGSPRARRLLSASDVRPSSTSTPVPSVTSAAASSKKPPVNGPRRRKNACSSGRSRS
jgi:nicotinamidase-related amidase